MRHPSPQPTLPFVLTFPCLSFGRKDFKGLLLLAESLAKLRDQSGLKVSERARERENEGEFFFFLTARPPLLEVLHFVILISSPFCCFFVSERTWFSLWLSTFLG